MRELVSCIGYAGGRSCFWIGDIGEAVKLSEGEYHCPVCGGTKMKMTVRKETYGKNLFIDIETEKTIKTYILCAGEITLMNITRK